MMADTGSQSLGTEALSTSLCGQEPGWQMHTVKIYRFRKKRLKVKKKGHDQHVVANGRHRTPIVFMEQTWCHSLHVCTSEGARESIHK